MAITLDEFAGQCRQALSENPGPEGRRKVCALVQDALKDKAFVEANIDPDGPERKVLYEDPAAWVHHPGAQLSRREELEAARSWPILGDLRPGIG